MLAIVSILFAVIAHMILGMLWYSPFLFGTYWMKQLKMKKSDMKDATPAMVKSLLLAVIHVFALHILLTWLRVDAIGHALVLGFLIWMISAMLSLANVVYEKRSFGVWIIYASYTLVSLLVSSAILAYW